MNMNTAEVITRDRCHRFTVVAVMAMATMLFAAFTAAYVMRRAGSDWNPVPLPGILRVTTLLLIASSVAVEAARRRAGRSWLGVTLALGGLFLAGQVLAWIHLRSGGFVHPAVIHGSFFLALCGVHAVHVIGGIVLLGAALRRPGLTKVGATYWHFVGLVWIWLYVMLSFW
jgi:cytochrome c oxidase subunit 3